MNLSFEGDGKVKVDIERLVQSEQFRRDLDAVRELARDIETGFRGTQEGGRLDGR